MMKSREALIARRAEPDWAKRKEPAEPTPAAQQFLETALALDESVLDNQERLEREIQALRRNNASLGKLLEDERRRHAAAVERRDYYMRYCIEIRTHLTHVMHAAHAANERALACAETPKSEAHPPAPTIEIEEALAAVIAQDTAPKEPVPADKVPTGEPS
jgi:hypothetical protein